ncbi:MAG TPA: carbamoyltransferase [Puia sp.]|nr:carbamoyltransferase [Puia sp.]
MAISILGISALYHDSAAALVIDGKIVAAAQEERFTRIKHDASFPERAIRYVLAEGGLDSSALTAIAYYEKPLLKFERILETYHLQAPKGLASFTRSIPSWVGQKLFIRRLMHKHFRDGSGKKIPILFPEHHLSHAASAFYPSPFQEAAILTIDGVGEWATTTICHGKNEKIKIMREMQFPHSIGLLYSAFTYYLGFVVNEGEYKLMGLAPFGDPNSDQTRTFTQKILTDLVDLREDGSVVLNMDYFNFATGLTMTCDRLWNSLFRLSRRTPESVITQSHMNLAFAIQKVLESIVIALARTARKITRSQNLVMAGGVALNCVANSKILQTAIFKNIWIQPAAGDAGGAIGAAMAVYHIWGGNNRETDPADSMQHAYLGPSFDNQYIRRFIIRNSIPYIYFEDFKQLAETISRSIMEGKVVGWFQGRMEFGPRALGNRSILADPKNPKMQKLLNEKIKFREQFRPFAPSVLAEDAPTYFDMDFASPYMLFTSYLKKCFWLEEAGNECSMSLSERLDHGRSCYPAITHMDYSARVQTVDSFSNPRFAELIGCFKNLTGTGMLINTSFNVRDEPIVCSPEDAWRCFIQTKMDLLVLGNHVVDKTRLT